MRLMSLGCAWALGACYDQPLPEVGEEQVEAPSLEASVDCEEIDLADKLRRCVETMSP